MAKVLWNFRRYTWARRVAIPTMKGWNGFSGCSIVQKVRVDEPPVGNALVKNKVKPVRRSAPPTYAITVATNEVNVE